MEKRLIIILLFVLLSGCSNEKTVACSRYDGADYLQLNIKADNDDITSIEVEEVFVLPAELLANQRYYEDLRKQLDSSCSLESDRLIRQYYLPLSTTYSLAKTTEALERDHYACK